MKNTIRLLGSTAALLCSMLVHAQNDEEPVTYNGEAGRVINENCVACHREGGIGPMQFETYDQVRPWAPLIQIMVANREMPPYAYDHGIGIQNLQGDWRLEQEQIDTIVAWVNQGAPLGNPDNFLPPPQLNDPSEWNFVDELGEPNLVIPSIPIDIPANGNDLWSTHYVPSGVTQNRCIRAIQVKPKGEAKSVVHHANSSIEIYDEEGQLDRYGMLT
nr:cytochrome c [Gammaproteobacteria bacterium]